MPRRSRSRKPEGGKEAAKDPKERRRERKERAAAAAAEGQKAAAGEAGAKPEGEKPEGEKAAEGQPLKQEPAKELPTLTNEVISIDLDDDDDVVNVVPVPVPTKKEAVKRESKIEPREERRKEKKAKVKKERKEADDDGEKKESRRQHEGRNRSGSRRRKNGGQHARRRPESSSSSSSSTSESESELYRRFKPYTKVQLINLVRKADLNGMTGQVIHPSTAVSPCPPGCLLVRLETGREIAVKPANLTPLKAFHVGPQQAKQSQEERLHQVLAQIKMNVDNVMERTMAIRDDGGGMLLDGEGAVQGGIGHML